MPAAYRKAKIPASLKAEVWQRFVGGNFSSKCYVAWCHAHITPFTFEAGHNIPESKGGETVIENLRPICAKCNKAMGNRYTIDEFSFAFTTQKASMAFPVCDNIAANRSEQYLDHNQGELHDGALDNNTMNPSPRTDPMTGPITVPETPKKRLFRLANLPRFILPCIKNNNSVTPITA